jgi:hypothetical protein
LEAEWTSGTADALEEVMPDFYADIAERSRIIE